jgi:hypothetical protein
LQICFPFFHLFSESWINCVLGNFLMLWRLIVWLFTLGSLGVLELDLFTRLFSIVYIKGLERLVSLIKRFLLLIRRLFIVLGNNCRLHPARLNDFIISNLSHPSRLNDSFAWLSFWRRRKVYSLLWICAKLDINTIVLAILVD